MAGKGFKLLQRGQRARPRAVGRGGQRVLGSSKRQSLLPRSSAGTEVGRLGSQGQLIWPCQEYHLSGRSSPSQSLSRGLGTAGLCLQRAPGPMTVLPVLLTRGRALHIQLKDTRGSHQAFSCLPRIPEPGSPALPPSSTSSNSCPATGPPPRPPPPWPDSPKPPPESFTKSLAAFL